MNNAKFKVLALKPTRDRGNSWGFLTTQAHAHTSHWPTVGFFHIRHRTFDAEYPALLKLINKS